MKEIQFFSCTRCLVYTTRTQTQSDHCLTNVNVDRSSVFSPGLAELFHLSIGRVHFKFYSCWCRVLNFIEL